MCNLLGTLPRAGGLLDQDAYHVLGMKAVHTARFERAEKDRKEREASRGTQHT